MIQTVKLNKGKDIKKQDIQYALMKARSTYEYANFILPNGKHILVTFFRDGTFEVATDVREQYQLFYDIKILKAIKNFYNITDFVYKWLNKLNK